MKMNPKDEGNSMMNIEYTMKVLDDGSKFWYLNNQLHREDGPAIEWASGIKSWWINGLRHREDGPAIEWPDGKKSWYLNGVEYTENVFLKKTLKVK